MRFFFDRFGFLGDFYLRKFNFLFFLYPVFFFLFVGLWIYFFGQYVLFTTFLIELFGFLLAGSCVFYLVWRYLEQNDIPTK